MKRLGCQWDFPAVTFWWPFPGSPVAGVSLIIIWEHWWLGETASTAPPGVLLSISPAQGVLPGSSWVGEMGSRVGCLRKTRLSKAPLHLDGSGPCPTCRSLLMAGRHGCSAEIKPLGSFLAITPAKQLSDAASTGEVLQMLLRSKVLPSTCPCLCVGRLTLRVPPLRWLPALEARSRLSLWHTPGQPSRGARAPQKLLGEADAAGTASDPEIA